MLRDIQDEINAIIKEPDHAKGLTVVVKQSYL